MPFLAPPTDLPGLGADTALAVVPSVQVFIGGQRRTDCWPEVVAQTAGLLPATATLVFPRARYGAQPARVGDAVTIWLGGVLIFQGHIADPDETQTIEAEEVRFTARDIRSRLYDTVCERDYNVPDDKRTGAVLDGDSGAGWTIREIIADLMRQHRVFTAQQPNPIPLHFRTSTVPNAYPGHMPLAGQPIGQALEQVLARADGRFGVRIVYGGSPYLECFPFPSSSFGGVEYAWVVRGTDRNAGPRAQPWGVANAIPARRTDYSQVRNRVTVIGAPQVTERAFTVHLPAAGVDGRAWDTAKEATVLNNWETYTQPGDEANPNPHYIADAEFVGRRYRIPAITIDVTEDGSVQATTNVSLLPRILQSDPIAPSAGNATPFAMYRFEGETEYTVVFADRFTIEDDRYIIFKDPIVTGPTNSKELPVAIYLEAAYQERWGLRHTTAVEGSASDLVVQHEQIERPEFRVEKIINGRVLEVDAGGIVPPVSGEPWDSVTVRDDSDALEEWAERRVKMSMEPVRSFTWELPRCDVGYRVGQRVVENGWDTGAMITQITHDLGDARAPTFATSLHAQSG